MNLKKFVSTISAVTIAASAFAGMAISASAAEIAGTKIIDVNFNDGSYGDVVQGQQWNPYASIDDSSAMRVGNGSYSVTIPDSRLQAKAENGDVVTIQFDWVWTQLSGKHAYFNVVDSNNTKIVNFDINCYDGKYSSATVLGTATGSGDDMPALADVKAGKDNPGMGDKTTYTLTFDYGANTVTWNDSRVNKTYTKSLPTGVGYIKTLQFGSNYNNANRRCYIDNIAVYTTVEEQNNDPVASDVQITGADYILNGKSAAYTAKVVDQFGNDYADTVTLALSSAPTGVTMEKGTVTVAEDAAEGTAVITATGDVTGVSGTKNVTIRPAEEYKSNITATYGEGDSVKLVDNETIYEDSSYSYYYPKYVKRADGWYSVAQGKLMKDEYYGYSNAPVKADITLTVAYDKVDENTNIVYYAEVEDILSDVAPLTQYAKRYSNGKAIKNASFDTPELPAGVYTVQLAGRNGSTSSKAYYTVTGCKEAVENVEINSENTCTLGMPGKLHIASSGNNVEGDYIIIKKIGDYTPVDPSPSEITPVGDTFDMGDGIFAKAFSFMGNANDGSFSEVVIDVAGSKEKSQTITTTNVERGSSVVFGIIFASDKAENLPGAEAISIKLQ